MLYDYEGNYIKLDIPKDNTDDSLGTLVTGLSGYGKTYYGLNSCSLYAKDGNRVCILDYQGGYSKEEIEKSNIDMSDVVIIKPRYWNLNFKDKNEFINEVSESIAKAIKTLGYKQDSLLKRVCISCFDEYGYISIAILAEELKAMIDNMNFEKKDDYKVAEMLLGRIDKYRDIDIRFINYSRGINLDKKIHIINLEQYSLSERMVIAAIFIELIWRETKKNRKSYDFLVLDEVHLLEKFYKGLTGSCLDTVLRESRKYGLRPIILTQLLYSFSKDDVDLLNQVGFKIMFKTTSREAKYMSKEFDDNEKSWERILKTLKKGEVVLSGKYIVNGIISSNVPIICKVISRTRGGK